MTCHVAGCLSRPFKDFFLSFENICNVQCHNRYILLPPSASPLCNKISSYEVHLYTDPVVHATHAFGTPLLDARLHPIWLAT